MHPDVNLIGTEVRDGSDSRSYPVGNRCCCYGNKRGARLFQQH